MELWELLLILIVGFRAHSVIEGRSSNTGEKSPSDAAYLEADDFLTSYGYYTPSGRFPAQVPNPSHRKHSDIERTKALKLFQSFYNLPESGELDNETTQLMQTPRCGYPDITSTVNTGDIYLDKDADASQTKKNHKNQHGDEFGINVDRMRRSWNIPRARDMRDKEGKLYKWRSEVMTWAFLRPSRKVYGAIQSWVIRDTMRMWEKYVPIKFKEVKFPWMDLEISFHSFAKKPNLDVFFNHSNRFVNERGAKKRRSPGPKTKDSNIAHAILPEKVSKTNQRHIHFDEDHDWGIVELWSVALHEIGHVVGLGHSTDPRAVMYPYNQDVTEFALDDLESIVALYGVHNENFRLHYCKMKIESVDYVFPALHFLNNRLYYFISGKHIQLRSARTTLRIRSYSTLQVTFPNSPSEFDVVFTDKTTENYIFIAGNRLYHSKSSFIFQTKIDQRDFPQTPKFAVTVNSIAGTHTVLFGYEYWWLFEFNGTTVVKPKIKHRFTSIVSELLRSARFAVQWTDGDVYVVMNNGSYFTLDFNVFHESSASPLKKGKPAWMESALCPSPVVPEHASKATSTMSRPSLMLFIIMSLIELY